MSTKIKVLIFLAFFVPTPLFASFTRDRLSKVLYQINHDDEISAYYNFQKIEFAIDDPALSNVLSDIRDSCLDNLSRIKKLGVIGRYMLAGILARSGVQGSDVEKPALNYLWEQVSSRGDGNEVRATFSLLKPISNDALFDLAEIAKKTTKSTARKTALFILKDQIEKEPDTVGRLKELQVWDKILDLLTNDFFVAQKKLNSAGRNSRTRAQKDLQDYTEIAECLVAHTPKLKVLLGSQAKDTVLAEIVSATNEKTRSDAIRKIELLTDELGIEDLAVLEEAAEKGLDKNAELLLMQIHRTRLIPSIQLLLAANANLSVLSESCEAFFEKWKTLR